MKAECSWLIPRKLATNVDFLIYFFQSS